MAKTNKEYIAMCILTCPTYEEAAKKAEISLATIYRLRQNYEFQKMLNKMKDTIFRDVMQKAQNYCNESLEVLRIIMNNNKCNDSSRVSAAKAILDLGWNVYNQENIIQKIEEIERRLNNNA